MKRKLQFILNASAASVLTLTALAQDPGSNSKLERSAYAGDRIPSAHRKDQLNGAVKASDVLGMTVKNYQDKKLGKVEELAVDVESGRIVQVIVSTGGFLGIGDSLTAVPPGALHHDVAKKVLHLDADAEKLKAAPRFENSQWAEHSDSNHLSSVYSHFGEEASVRFIYNPDVLPDVSRDADASPNKALPINTDTPRNIDGLPNAPQTRSTDEVWERNRMARERQSMIPVSRLRYMQKATKLIGIPVKNHQDETLGKVDNMLVDVQSGRLVAFIVASGGFLGMGDELSAVPPTALRFNVLRDALELDTTKELLSRAPHFKASEWPDFNQPVYSDSVYRAYKVEPYFTTNAVSNPDNTARNVRDRNDQTLTPFDQGNSRADTDTTAQIRKGILAGQEMSVNAKNVKIITKKGMFTLRGPVNTVEEKRMIGEIANTIARVENVDNQLEVK